MTSSSCIICSTHWSSSGVEGVPVTDRSLGIPTVKEGRPRSILLDIPLSRMDGPEVCQQFHADPDPQNNRIVPLTAMGDSQVRVTVVHARAALAIQKPFDVDALGDTLKAALGERGLASSKENVSRKHRRASRC